MQDQEQIPTPLPTDRRAMLAGIGGLAAGALLAGKAHAGPLTPPPGPIAPTPGPEPRTAINATNTPGDANSLFKITQPGSYYLTANITGVVGRHGIEIVASGVTLDLMGFDLSGVVGSLDGVSATVFNLTDITIRNGSVRGWGNDGVDLANFGASNSAVIDVRASSNGGNGIRVGFGGMITGCSAFQNTGNGISINEGSTITECSAYQNTIHGIVTGNGCTITGCSASRNGQSGIFTDVGCTVSNCTSFANGESGIDTFLGCTISNCTVRNNALNGILVSNDCIVVANMCSNNGFGGNGAGIHATGSDNRIEGNNCTDADRGIDVVFGGNLIVKNTCSGNGTNYSIAAGNRYGPIINITGGGTASVSGNSAASTLTSTDPWANFAF